MSGPATRPSPVATAGRVAVAVGFTAFMGWTAVDLALARGATTMEFAAWAWAASLGWIVVTYGILGTRADLGDRWHAIRPWERSSRIYRRLGVPHAKRFMPNGDHAIRLVRRFRPGYRLVTDRASAAAWARQTRSKETGHAIHLAMTLPLGVAQAATGSWAALIALLVLDIVFDLYPILAQRYNRARIEALLEGHRRP